MAKSEASGPQGRSRTFYMSDEEYEQLTAQAERNGRTRSGQLIQLVKQEDERAA